jgi:hypothetical protein
MEYNAVLLNQYGALSIDCSNIAVVAVSGDSPNICGHLLLHILGRGGGHYFHVSEFRLRPKYMNESGYRRYLHEAGKVEIRRRYLSLPNPSGALHYLDNLVANKWMWLVLPNNCVAFVEEVIRAGGGTWSSYSNCPDVATSDTISQHIQRFLGQLESEIYRLYGVPLL